MKKHLTLALFCTVLSSVVADEASKPTETIKAPVAVQFLQQSDSDTAPENLSASMLIQDCIRRFPTEELKLSGRLTMRRKYGIEMAEYNFVANVCWGTAEPYGTYNFFALDGHQVDCVTIKRDATGNISISRDMKTPAGAQIPPPKLTDSILGSDVTWIDATMDFLWWKNPELVGSGEVKGRDCDIIKLISPEPTDSCTFGKVWLDKAQRVLMQATQNNKDGKETRRMWVRAVQKLEVAKDDERWVIKDLEVETTGSGHRTRLHFEDVKIVR